LTLAATLVASPTHAQPVASSFDELRGIVKTGQLIIVLDETGKKTTGKLVEASSSSLVLLIKEKRETVLAANARRAEALARPITRPSTLDEATRHSR
jgi:hypothetical protein